MKVVQFLVPTIFAWSALLGSTFAAYPSEGGMHGGGGDVVVLPSGDDRIRLADPWLRSENPIDPSLCAEPFKLPNEVTDALKRVDYVLTRHGANHSFIDNDVLNPSIHYCLVNQLPNRRACRNRMDYGNLPPGAHVEPVACTEGSYTWVIKRLLPSMSVREQAQLYTHEGLRRINTSEDSIAEITDGLSVLLDKLNLQLSGTLGKLTDEQKQLVLDMNVAIVLSGITNRDPRSLTPTDIDQINQHLSITDGGGIAYDGATASPSAFIGVGVVLDSATVVGARTQIVASDLRRSQIGSDSRIVRSTINSSQIRDRVTIQNSNIKVDRVDDGAEIDSSSLEGKQIGKDSVIERSKWSSGRLVRRYGSIGESNHIVNSELAYVLVGDHNEISDSTLQGIRPVSADPKIGQELLDLVTGTFSIGNGSRISHVIVQNRGGQVIIGEQVTIRNIPSTQFILTSTGYQTLGELALGIGTIGIGVFTKAIIDQGRGQTLMVADGSMIDLESQAVCFGQNEYVDYGMMIGGVDISSVQDLKGRCRSH